METPPIQKAGIRIAKVSFYTGLMSVGAGLWMAWVIWGIFTGFWRDPNDMVEILVFLFFSGLILGIAAIVTGIVSQRDKKTSNERESNAGMILGLLGFVFACIASIGSLVIMSLMD
jgi:hypothetical protein